MKKESRYIFALVSVLLLLFILNLLIGSVHIPISDALCVLLGQPVEHYSWTFIIWQSRLPQAVTALLCGGALAACGLMLQTAFKNPLAGPSILGIDAGASLGVALVMLWMGGSLSVGTYGMSGYVSVLIGAFVGAMAVMGLLLFLSTLIRSNVMLLIAGIMLGYITSSAIALLNFFATAEGVQSYLVWGMGTFGGVSSATLPLFAIVVIVGLIGALLLVKPLNALLLGEYYAENLGVNTRWVRNLLLLVTGVLTAVTTAFCGPIAFIGLAVPHIARMWLGTVNHRMLLPFTILCGSAVALLCNLLCALPGRSGIIPLNAITPLIGAPVIIYVIVRQRTGRSLH